MDERSDRMRWDRDQADRKAYARYQADSAQDPDRALANLADYARATRSEPPGSSSAPPCPECGIGPDWIEVGIRDGVADMADAFPSRNLPRGTAIQVFDVGYRCGKCDHVWGFEVLTDAYLEAVELLTGGRDRQHMERAVDIIARWHGKLRDPLGEGA